MYDCINDVNIQTQMEVMNAITLVTIKVTDMNEYTFTTNSDTQQIPDFRHNNECKFSAEEHDN